MSTILTQPPPEPVAADPSLTNGAPAGAAADAQPAATGAAPSPAPEWAATLPDDLKAEKGWERFKDVAALAKSYRDLEKRMGTATKSDVPADPTGYDLKLPPVPGLVADDAAISHFKGIFHRAGVGAAAAQTIVEAYAEYEAQRVVNEHRSWIEQHQEIVAEWGQPLFARRATLAADVVREFGGERFTKWLNASKMGDNPELIRFLGMIGEQFAEDGVIETATEHRMDEGDIQRRINELREQIVKLPEGSPLRERLTQERYELYKKMPGGTKPIATFG